MNYNFFGLSDINKEPNPGDKQSVEEYKKRNINKLIRNISSQSSWDQEQINFIREILIRDKSSLGKFYLYHKRTRNPDLFEFKRVEDYKTLRISAKMSEESIYKVNEKMEIPEQVKDMDKNENAPPENNQTGDENGTPTDTIPDGSENQKMETVEENQETGIGAFAVDNDKISPNLAGEITREEIERVKNLSDGLGENLQNQLQKMLADLNTDSKKLTEDFKVDDESIFGYIFGSEPSPSNSESIGDESEDSIDEDDRVIKKVGFGLNTGVKETKNITHHEEKTTKQNKNFIILGAQEGEVSAKTSFLQEVRNSLLSRKNLLSSMMISNNSKDNEDSKEETLRDKNKDKNEIPPLPIPTGTIPKTYKQPTNQSDDDERKSKKKRKDDSLSKNGQEGNQASVGQGLDMNKLFMSINDMIEKSIKTIIPHVLNEHSKELLKIARVKQEEEMRLFIESEKQKDEERMDNLFYNFIISMQNTINVDPELEEYRDQESKIEPKNVVKTFIDNNCKDFITSSGIKMKEMEETLKEGFGLITESINQDSKELERLFNERDNKIKCLENEVRGLKKTLINLLGRKNTLIDDIGVEKYKSSVSPLVIGASSSAKGFMLGVEGNIKENEQSKITQNSKKMSDLEDETAVMEATLNSLSDKHSILKLLNSDQRLRILSTEFAAITTVAKELEAEGLGNLSEISRSLGAVRRALMMTKASQK